MILDNILTLYLITKPKFEFIMKPSLDKTFRISASCRLIASNCLVTSLRPIIHCTWLGFPSQAVVSAYLQPRVDESREPFSWGSPDLVGLRDYAERKFGWSRNRTDQILQPVVNRMSQKTVSVKQLLINQEFF